MRFTDMSDNIIPIVKLRALEPEDLDILYRIENDTTLWDAGCTNVPYSRYTLHNYIADSTNDIYTDKQLRLMIENAEGEDVGIIDMMNFDPRHQRAEVGVVVMRRFRRRGYATAAVKELLGYALKTLNLHQLYVFVDSNNVGSNRLFSSVGFSKTAVLSQWLRIGKDYHDALLLQYFL